MEGLRVGLGAGGVGLSTGAGVKLAAQGRGTLIAIANLTPFLGLQALPKDTRSVTKVV